MTANSSAALRMALPGFVLWLGCVARLCAEDAAVAALPAAPAVAVPAPPAAPALVVTDPASPLELGDVYAQDVRDIRLQVLNRSDKPVKVTRVRATCPCTVPRKPSPEPIPAGGSGEVGAQLFAATLHEGAFRRLLIIELEGAPQPLITVELRGTKVPTVAVMRDSINSSLSMV